MSVWLPFLIVLAFGVAFLFQARWMTPTPTQLRRTGVVTAVATVIVVPWAGFMLLAPRHAGGPVPAAPARVVQPETAFGATR
jgi:hypothetical protein